MKKIIWAFIFIIIVISGGYLFIQRPFLNFFNNRPLPASIKEPVSGSEILIKEPLEPSNKKASSTIEQNIDQSIKIKTIVLVTLDTVRADHYGFMGYPRNTTPFLDKLAQEGILFDNAFTVVSETGPSISSIFTSLYPFEHQVVNNMIKLDGFRTLPEYLKEQKYITGGFASVMYLSAMNNKFDYFDFEGDPALGPELGARRRSGDKIIGRAKEWLGQISPNEKVFLWVHLFDAHLPFNSGINYIENKEDRLSGDALVDFWVKEQGANLDFFTGEQKESLTKVMNQYDGELQFIDKQLEALFNFMEQGGYNKNALWIITSDHGEGLGSHSYFDHFERVYNEQLRAPIIFYHPEINNGKIINSLVENIDILPTLADLVGFKIKGRISGKSLTPLIAGSKDSIRNYVFSKRGEVVKVGLNEYATKHLPVKNPQDEEFLGQLYSLQDDNYKLIYSPDNQGRDKFFDLQKDPNELNNLINNPNVNLIKDDMKNKIMKILEGKADLINSDSSLMDSKLEEALRSLGY